MDDRPLPGPCAWPSKADTLFDEAGAVIQVWSFGTEHRLERPVLPTDSGFLEFRESIVLAGAATRHPVLIMPDTIPVSERGVWEAEHRNNRLAYSGAVGQIRPLICLEALLFAEQNRRFSQIRQPTEFLASILVRSEQDSMVVIFGAGDGLFIPQSVYGFDIVDRYRSRGWRYSFALHNHTVQRSGDRLVLGVPVPSTSDVSVARWLRESRGLESVRVTNGFFTFVARVSDLSSFEAR